MNREEQIDILAFGAHPDDIEIACSGTLIKHIKKGSKVVVCDLTRGELGTRGNVEIRMKEAMESAHLMGLSERINLNFEDGLFEINPENLSKVVAVIRKYKPSTILCNAPRDRHPDHGRGHELVMRAAFLSGLVKYKVESDKANDQFWQVKNVFSYIQDNHLEPDFIVDVSEEWTRRTDALMCFKSQFYNPDSKEMDTPISGLEFLQYLEGRAKGFGRLIGGEYGEGFLTHKPLKISVFQDLLL